MSDPVDGTPEGTKAAAEKEAGNADSREASGPRPNV